MIQSEEEPPAPCGEALALWKEGLLWWWVQAGCTARWHGQHLLRPPSGVPCWAVGAGRLKVPFPRHSARHPVQGGIASPQLNICGETQVGTDLRGWEEGACWLVLTLQAQCALPQSEHTEAGPCCPGGG